jgi:hypothetical protein
VHHILALTTRCSNRVLTTRTTSSGVLRSLEHSSQPKPTHGSGGSWPAASLPASIAVRAASWSTSGPKVCNFVGPSAWELACHALPTRVFAAHRLFTLSVSTRYRPSQTAPSGTQGARLANDHDRRNTVKRRLTGNQLGRSVMADLTRRAGMYVHVTDGYLSVVSPSVTAGRPGIWPVCGPPWF